MKHVLLTFCLLFVASFAFSQSSLQTVGQSNNNPELSIYPNPATNFFKLSNNNWVKEIIVINLAGRRVKSFDYGDDRKYTISDLPRGMYLVQLRDFHNRTITTRRISIR